MRPYLALLSARLRALLQYRAAAAAGVGTRIFWGLIRVMIFTAFYRSSTAPQPMSLPEVVTYIWLGQAMLAMILWSADREVWDSVRTGTVACELLRPLDLYGAWYSRSLANRVAPTMLQAVPLVLLAGPLLGMAPPASAAAGLAWAVSTAVAFLLCAAMATLVSVSLLWTVSGEGVARLVPALVYSFSGMIVPLPLLPDWLRSVVEALPFRGLIDVPFRLYIGHLPAGEAPALIAGQLAWTLALVALGRCGLAHGLRRLVSHGG